MKSQLPLLQRSTSSLQKRSSNTKSETTKDKGNGNNGNGRSDKKDEKKDEKANNPKQSSDKKNDGGDSNGEGGEKEIKPELIFTSEQDAALLKMKEENKSWKDISTELNKPVWALKQRFKELKKDDGDGDGEKKEGGKDNSKEDGEKNSKKGEGKEAGASGKDKEGKDENGKNKANTGKKQDKGGTGRGEGKAEGNKADKDGENARGSGVADVKSSLAKWVVLGKDKRFTLADLEKLGDIATAERTEDWLKVSSRFYDITGRRVDAEDLKDKCEKLEMVN